MSPTSYQAAPPRAIDTTRLAALLQPHPHQVPDKCPELGHADAQTAPCVQPRRVRKCSELLKCCRAPESWTPQPLGPPLVAGALRTCAGTYANDRSQLSASRVGVSSTQGQRSTACRSSW